MRAARRIFAIAAFVGLLVGGWLFTARHESPVEIDYFLGRSGAIPLWMALLAAFGSGAAVATGALGWQLLRLSLLARRYRKTVRRLELEVHELQNLPLDPTADVRIEAEPEPPAVRALARGG